MQSIRVFAAVQADSAFDCPRGRRLARAKIRQSRDGSSDVAHASRLRPWPSNGVVVRRQARTARRSADGGPRAALASNHGLLQSERRPRRRAADPARGSIDSRALPPCCASTRLARGRIHSRVSCTTRPPSLTRSICRAISYSSAFCRKRNELRFFTSAFVPSSAWPRGRTDTLASQRRLPSSMLPSLTPEPHERRAQAG